MCEFGSVDAYFCGSAPLTNHTKIVTTRNLADNNSYQRFNNSCAERCSIEYKKKKGAVACANQPIQL